MQFPDSLLAYAVLVPALTAVTAHTFTRKPKTPANAALGWTLLSLLVSSVSVTLTLLADREPWIYIFNESKFVGLAFSAVLMLLFYFEFMRIKITVFEKAAMLAVPALTVFFALTNPMHHFFRKSYSIMYDNGFAYFIAENGIWMYVHLIFAYIITFIGLALLVRHALRRSAVYREQILLMALGIFIAFGASIGVSFGGIPDYADVSVIALAFAGLTSYAGLVLYSPKNMLNLARDLAIKSIDAPFILFDDMYELADYNKCAAGYLGLTENMLGNLKLGDFISDYLNLTDRDIDGSEVLLASETWEEVYCRVYARYFTDKGGKPSGCVILLENITQGKRMIKELNFSLHRDKLTGMPNFLAFEQEFDILAKNDCQSMVLLYFNINGMKLVNNAFGRAHGDEVIKTVASFIMSACPDRKLCARVSNDEFAVLLTDCREANALELGVAVNLRLKSAKHLRLPVSVAYGATTRMWDAEPLERMMRRAGDDIVKQKLLYAENDNTAILDALRCAIEDAGIENAEHIGRTRETAAKFGTVLKLEPFTLRCLDILACIHGVGMLATTPGLLHKPDPFTPEEWETIKLHCAKGYRIALSSPVLAPAAYGILSHHEWWDGTGYPNGLAGENIPLISRIISIVGEYYRWLNGVNGSESASKAVEKLTHGAGRQFDPELTDIFIKEFANG